MTIIMVRADDSEVICDLCNAEIGMEEGGGFMGSYSLCQKCLERIMANASPKERKAMVVFEKYFKKEVIKKRILDEQEALKTA